MSITDYDLAYLLKELEIQFEIESKARDRAEQMVQYLLTTLAAVLGATLILVQTYSVLLMMFFGVLLIYLFSATSFYRTCRLRNIITQTRLARYLIRNELQEGEVKQAHLLVGIDEELTGFSRRMIHNLHWFVVICGILGGFVFYLGGKTLIQEFALFTQISALRTILLVLLVVVGLSGTSFGLSLVLRHFEKISEKLLQAHDIRRE